MSFMRDKTGRRLDTFEVAGIVPDLLTFHAAVANRDTAPVNVLLVGDSITEGTGATTMANRWQSRLATMVRTRFPIAGVVGVPTPHLPGLKTNGVTYPYPIVQAGTARTGGSGNAVTYGLGRRTDPLTATTQSDTFTFVGTSLDVFYADATDGGVMSITIDGGTPTLVDTRNAAPTGGGLKWSSPALTPGSHTVVIGYDATSQASSTVNFEGVYLYNGDETKGFRFWDAGHHGYTSASWVSSPLNFQRSFRLTKADLVVIELGANDFTNGVTAAQFQTNIASLVATIRAQLANVQSVMPSIVLMMVWERATGGTSGATATEPWKNYVTAARTIADADDRICLLDMSQRMPTPVAYPNPTNQTSNLGLYADTVHLTDKGHAKVADEVFKFLFAGSVSSGDATVLHAGQAARTPAKTGYITAGHGAATSAVLNSGVLRMAPIDLPDCGITRIGADVTAAGSAGCTIRCAIYADDGTGGRPGTLLLESVVAGDVVAVAENTVSLGVRGGRYWIGAAVQGAPATQPTVRVFTTPAVVIPMPAAATVTQNSILGVAQASVTGACPATFSTADTNSSVMPRVFLKIQV